MNFKFLRRWRWKDLDRPPVKGFVGWSPAVPRKDGLLTDKVGLIWWWRGKLISERQTLGVRIEVLVIEFGGRCDWKRGFSSGATTWQFRSLRCRARICLFSFYLFLFPSTKISSACSWKLTQCCPSHPTPDWSTWHLASVSVPGPDTKYYLLNFVHRLQSIKKG